MRPEKTKGLAVSGSIAYRRGLRDMGFSRFFTA
jgi:hypothetical protein